MSSKLLSAALIVACATGSAASVAAPGDTTIGGKGYFDLTSIDETSDGSKTSASGTGLDAKRFYFTAAHQFDEKWSANLTTDFNYVSNDNETQLFVKKAYFEGKFSDGFVLRVGSTDVPLVPFVEGLYGNRYIENVLVEHLGLEASADWGVHALGKFAGGKAHYAVSAINGNGYKNPSRSRSLDLDGRVDFEPMDGLTVAFAYRTGKRGLDKENVTTYHTAQRSELLAAYVKPKYRVGAEYFRAQDWNQVLSPASDRRRLLGLGLVQRQEERLGVRPLRRRDAEQGSGAGFEQHLLQRGRCIPTDLEARHRSRLQAGQGRERALQDVERHAWRREHGQTQRDRRLGPGTILSLAPKQQCLKLTCPRAGGGPLIARAFRSTVAARDVVLGGFLARVREDLACFVELHELAEIQERRVVGNACRLLHVVRHDEHRHLVAQRRDELLDSGRCRRVESGSRLVEEQHLRLRRQRPGDAQPLHLPAGE